MSGIPRGPQLQFFECNCEMLSIMFSSHPESKQLFEHYINIGNHLLGFVFGILTFGCVKFLEEVLGKHGVYPDGDQEPEQSWINIFYIKGH